MATQTNHDHDHKPQPNSRMCFGCGLENPVGLQLRFVDNGVDTLWTEFTAPQHFQSYPGVVHGGVVSSILDEAAGRVPMILDPDRFMMTVKLEVRYRHPVPVETLLKITARIVKNKGRLMTSRAELTLPDGTLAAEADALLADIPTDLLDTSQSVALGWRVWPEE